MSKRRQTSPVWEYFEKLKNGKIMCKVRNKELADSGGTSNLQNHLCMKHADKAKSALTEGKAAERNRRHYNCFPAQKSSLACASELMKLITEMVAQDLHPLSVVEGNGFCQMLNLVEPDYHIPSRPHI